MCIRDRYIPAKITVVIRVVYKNFLRIFGFLGAPGSIPSKSFLNGLSLCLIPIGKTEKKNDPPNNYIHYN